MTSAGLPMPEPIPYSLTVRPHWPKLAEAEGYSLRAATASDVEALVAFLKSLSREECAISAEAIARGLVFVAEDLMRGGLAALFAIEPTPVQIEGESQVYGRIAYWERADSAADVKDPPLDVRTAFAALRALSRGSECQTLFAAAPVAWIARGRREEVPGHAFELCVVRSNVRLRYDFAADPARKNHLPDHPVERHQGVPTDVADLAAQLTPLMRGSLDRSAEALKARYPAEAFETFLRRDSSGAVAAAAIVRFVPAEGPLARAASAFARGRLVIADWLCGQHDYDPGLAVVRALIVAAEATPATGIDVIIPEWWPWFHHFQWHGFLVEPIEELTLVRAGDRHHDDLWFRENFFTSAGDLRLV